jgi:hypothetical protein
VGLHSLGYVTGSREEAFEEARYLPGGKFVVYLTNKTPILDQNGEVSGICGVGVDITYQ